MQIANDDKRLHELFPVLRGDAKETVDKLALPDHALAREDGEPKVRQVALQQLGSLPDRKGLEVLRGIAFDPSASVQDRGLAQKSGESVISALDRAQSLRTRTNPLSPLQVKLTLDGCTDTCLAGQEMRIQIQNLSSVALSVVVVVIDSTGESQCYFPVTADRPTYYNSTQRSHNRQ